MSRRAAIACLVGLTLVGCRRNTGPDENYQKASALYGQLYATQLDDAYGDPRMDEVVALLRKVDGRSIDAHAAQMMLSAIQHGREALAKDHAERERFAKAAEAASPAAPTIDPRQFLAENTPDAGSADQDPYGPGASISDLNAKTGGCLVDNEPFNEQGTGVTGTVYRVAPSDGCRSKVPGMIGQAVLVSGGKIYRRIVDPRPPEAAKPAAPPDAGAALARARPAAASAPDAGEPQYQIYVPGGPMPGATAPAAGGTQQ